MKASCLIEALRQLPPESDISWSNEGLAADIPHTGHFRLGFRWGDGSPFWATTVRVRYDGQLKPLIAVEDAGDAEDAEGAEAGR